MDNMVCEICGSGSIPQLIRNCARCNAYEHCYCMQVLTLVIPQEWYCHECQKYANGVPEPSQGVRTELQRPWHDCEMKERGTPKLHLSHSNIVHQNNPSSSKKFGNAKVKFISSEEVALLSKERPPYGRPKFAMQQNQVHPASPDMKYSSNLKCISPTRSDTQVQGMKQCAAASLGQTKIQDRSYFSMQQRQVCSASPPKVKQSSNMQSMSPNRRDMQVQALKQIATASRDQAKIGDRPNVAMQQSQVLPASPDVKQLSNMKCISPKRNDTQVNALKQIDVAHDQAKGKDENMEREKRSGGSMRNEPVEGKFDSLIEDKTREKKRANIDGETNSKIQDEPKEEKGTLCVSDDGTGCKSKMESLSHSTDVLVTINPSVEYSRRPPPEICWTGCLFAFCAGAKHNLGKFRAQFPSKVSHKVCDIVKMLPGNLQLELLPRMREWPNSFERNRPVHEDIGLFLFPNEPNGHEEKHPSLLAASCNFVLRVYVDDIKLLIYSSEVLPPDSQWIDGENYLWGIFVRPKGKGNHR